MDNYPATTSEPSTSSSSEGAIPLDQIVIYPAAHTDDNAPSVVDGVIEAREALSSLAVSSDSVVGNDAANDNRVYPKVLLHDVDNAKLEPPIPNFSRLADLLPISFL